MIGLIRNQRIKYIGLAHFHSPTAHSQNKNVLGGTRNGRKLIAPLFSVHLDYTADDLGYRASYLVYNVIDQNKS